MVAWMRQELGQLNRNAEKSPKNPLSIHLLELAYGKRITMMQRRK